MATLSVTKNADFSLSIQIQNDFGASFPSVEVRTGGFSGTVVEENTIGGTLDTSPLNVGTYYYITSTSRDGDNPQAGPLSISATQIDAEDDLIQYFQASEGNTNLGFQPPNDAGTNALRGGLRSTSVPTPTGTPERWEFRSAGGNTGAEVPNTAITNGSDSGDICCTFIVELTAIPSLSNAFCIYEEGGSGNGVSIHSSDLPGIVFATWINASFGNPTQLVWQFLPLAQNERAIVSVQLSVDAGGVTVRKNGVIVEGPGSSLKDTPTEFSAHTDGNAIGTINSATRFFNGSTLSDNTGNAFADMDLYALARYRVNASDSNAVDIGQSDQSQAYQSAIAEVERFVAEQTGLSGLLASGGERSRLRDRSR